MKKDEIFYSSVFMALSAGFVDTSTFTSANGLFSAHITGNLVVFAYKLSNHSSLGSYINLISFPVFIAAVIFTVKVNNQLQNQKKITSFIGVLLIIAGITAFFLRQNNISTGFLYHFMLMIIVFAMGIHNAVNRLYASSVYGPTTVMTGNTTKAIIDFFNYNSEQHTPVKFIDLEQSLVLLISFVSGCILGALISYHFGLVSVLIPGFIITVYYLPFFQKV